MYRTLNELVGIRTSRGGAVTIDGYAKRIAFLRQMICEAGGVDDASA